MQMAEEIYLEYRIRKYKEHPANTRKEYEVRKKIKKRYNEILNPLTKK